MTSEVEISFPSPLYVVVAPLGPQGATVQPPLVATPQSGTFDEDLLPALAGIWYAMHLPKSRFETLNLASFKAVQNVATRFPRPHSIALIPDVLLESPALMRQLVEPYEPTLIIAPPERFDTAHRVSSALDFTLAPVSLDGLDQWVLDGHWATLTSRWSHEWPGAEWSPA